MKNKLRCWEAALMAGVAIALLWGMRLDQEQQKLASQVVRLHVVANSDTQEDQRLKLLVRDGILEQAAALCPPGTGLDAALEQIEANTGRLAAVGREIIARQGCDAPVTASLERMWFPTKAYQDFSLPAGQYTALRVVIGEGKGQNWWCVLYPPLCLGSASQSVEQAAQAGLFSEEQAALITGRTEEYVLKFKAIELWEQFLALWMK